MAAAHQNHDTFTISNNLVTFVVFQNIFRMPSKGKYVAGRQVSRWDAESDIVDIQYRHFDKTASSGLADFFSGKKGNALKVLLLVVFFFTGLIIGYIIRRNIHEKYIAPKPDPSPVPVSPIYQVNNTVVQLNFDILNADISNTMHMSK